MKLEKKKIAKRIRLFDFRLFVAFRDNDIAKGLCDCYGNAVVRGFEAGTSGVLWIL